MKVHINNKLIRSFNPCYDPSEKVSDENETLPVIEWVAKYRATVPAQDIIWLLCRKEFMADRDCRLFAVWCAREALKLVDNPDIRSIDACDVSERFVNGEATEDELTAAWDAVGDASRDAVGAAAWDAWNTARAVGDAWDAAEAAAEAARNAAWNAARAARNAAWNAARADRAARDAAWAARNAAMDAAWDAQLNKLMTYFEP